MGDGHAPCLPMLLPSSTEHCKPLLECVLGAAGAEAEVLAPCAKDVACHICKVNELDRALQFTSDKFCNRVSPPIGLSL